jgi:hypothetical protein
MKEFQGSLEKTRRLFAAPALGGEQEADGDVAVKAEGKHVTLDVPSPRDYNLLTARRPLDTTREVLVSSLIGSPTGERPSVPAAPEVPSPKGKCAYHMISQNSAALILGAHYKR